MPLPTKGPANDSEPGAAAGTAAKSGAATPETASARTFSAPSGKHYAIAQDDYPEEVPEALAAEILRASQGDLIELGFIHGKWAYGRRFKKYEGVVSEGVFRLDWVRGVRLVLEDGQRHPVEVDIYSPEYGFQPPRAADTSAKLRLKRMRKKVEDVAQSWDKAAAAGGLAAQVTAATAAAEKAASALAKADEEGQQARRRKAERPPSEARPAGEAARRRQAGSADASPGSKTCAAQRRSSSSSAQRSTSVPRAWEAQWEQQVAHLENLLSASSSGVEDCSGGDGGAARRPVSVQKKMLTRKAARSLLRAKRSGELHAIAEEWEKAQCEMACEMASKASDLSALNDKVKRSLPSAHSIGELDAIAEEVAGVAERKAAEVRELKERVFRAMFSMKQARDLQETSSDMDDAQRELESKALQLKSLMKRAWQGMVETRRTRELERIADEMAEQLQEKADALKHRIREGLLRAHRDGELLTLRDELDELADSVALLNDEVAAARGSKVEDPRAALARRRWAEHPSSDSEPDSAAEPRDSWRRRYCDGQLSPTRASPLTGSTGDGPASPSSSEPGDQHLRPRLPLRLLARGGRRAAGEAADVSCSDASSCGAPSPVPEHDRRQRQVP